MADENHRLHQEIQAARRLRESLASLMEDDPELTADMVEAETGINEAIQAAVELYCSDSCSIDALDAHISLMETRKARLKKRMETTRAALCIALEQAGRRSVETALGTATLKSLPRQLVVHPDGEADIPTHYWKSGKPSLDKRKLKADLEAGKEVKGARLDNGGAAVQITFK